MATPKASRRTMSLRERECHRYYQPWLDAHGSSLNVASHVESIAQHDLLDQGYTPRSSRDKALIAFAQLAVQRLNVKRAMVSLIDANSQYILAEGTRTSFTGDDSDVWLGSAILTRSDAVCEHCFINTCAAHDADGRTFSGKGLIVDDCRLDSRFDTRPYVVAENGVRFYAGVPIVSRSGHMIGAYAVSDEFPRDGLRVEELQFMQEIAQAVMEHLEWARDRVDRFKGERIVRGMAAFIEGASSVKDSASKEKTHKSHGTASPRPRSKPSPEPQTRREPSIDKLGNMFDRAGQILRESTLADGAVIFGALAGNINRSSTVKIHSNMGGSVSASTDSTPPSPGSESDRHGTASDSDTGPFSRPCRLLALSLADEQARADIEHKSALSLGTLEKYYKLFPRGRTFHFSKEGSGFSSGDESASDNNTQHTRKGRLDHRELLKKIPGAKSVTFLPLYDYAEDRLTAACFLWTAATGRMMSLDEDLSYLHAFGNSVMSEVSRINAQKNEAAKTTFIASMSHELRSPLHGILGSTEFLKDTATDAYQAGLIASITTCGKTLLDTLNHVLDYSKINKLGRREMRRHAKQNKVVNLTSDPSSDSMNMTAEVDVGMLVEEVVEAVTAGHAFKKQHGRVVTAGLETSIGTSVDQALVHDGSSTESRTGVMEETDGIVCVLLDISPKRSWLVRTQPGALRRIIMNLFGNALKYTTSGFIAVSLRAQETGDSSKIDTYIRVVDSGKGISEDFLRDRLFVPFSQEDSFQPGTGLGLSIVKQIVDSLGGSVDVKSQPNMGTEIGVHLELTPADGHNLNLPDQEILDTVEQTRGQTLVILDTTGSEHNRPAAHNVSRLEETLSEICDSWFEMRVVRSTSMEDVSADFFLYSEPPSIDVLLERHKKGLINARKRQIPMIIICMNAEEAVKVARDQSSKLGEKGSLIEVIPQPCGPRKLAKALIHCMRKVDALAAKEKAESETGSPNGERASNDVNCVEQQDPTAAQKVSGPSTSAQKVRAPDANSKPPSQLIRRNADRGVEREEPPRDVPLSTAVSFPSPPPFDPSTPALYDVVNGSSKAPGASKKESNAASAHVLVVDDNKINLQLLVMFMKKLSFSYAEAENGQIALDHFKEACLPGPHARPGPNSGRRFDFILMDISMPVMNGMEATKRIREFESENGLGRTMVIALTGLASAQAQREATMAGIDIFLPKPVKFAELRKLLGAG